MYIRLHSNFLKKTLKFIMKYPVKLFDRVLTYVVNYVGCELGADALRLLKETENLLPTQ